MIVSGAAKNITTYSCLNRTQTCSEFRYRLTTYTKEPLINLALLWLDNLRKGRPRRDLARLRRNQIDVTAKISKSTKMRRPGEILLNSSLSSLRLKNLRGNGRFSQFAVQRGGAATKWEFRAETWRCRWPQQNWNFARRRRGAEEKNVRWARKLLEFALQGRGGIPEAKNSAPQRLCGKNPHLISGSLTAC
jgi:hypothetical protein